MDAEEVIVIITSTLFITAGVAVIWMAMQSRRHIREMEHRERLAMIERGMVPPPEVDPAAFDRLFSPAPPRGGIRTRVAGVFMISLGLAFMFMLTLLTGEPGIGVGIGGAFAIVGAGFLVSSFLTSRDAPPPLRAHQIQKRDVSGSTPPDFPTS